MRLIDVSTKTHKNKFVKVDDVDFDVLNQWKWSAEKVRVGFYAIRAITKDGKRTSVRMHAQICCAGEGMQVDHHDGDGLNNQRHNLRESTASQNQQNRRVRTVQSSKFKGVIWNKAAKSWAAHITNGDMPRSLGNYLSEEAAAGAYNIAAKEAFGEFASINDEIMMPAEEVAAQRKPFRRGEGSNLAKLNDEKVLKIRAATGLQREIASHFGVTQTLVSQIKSRKVWAHLPEAESSGEAL